MKTSIKPLWSICLICRNEAKTLPRAIESLKEFQKRGGEVVLLDTGSTDNSAQIARDAGFKVEEVGTRFLTTITKELAKEVNEHFLVEKESTLPILKEGDTLFDFAAARNYCSSLASKDMISWMDCDEAFTALDINKINDLITSGFDQFEYNFVFAHLPDGSPSVQFTQSKMHDRRKQKWSGVVHEVLTGPGRRKYLDKSILHLEHYQNHETNRTGYLRGLALDCFQNPEKDRQSHYLGRELLWTGHPKSAIKELRRHVEMNRWPAERAQSMNFIGQAYDMIGDKQMALESWEHAFWIDSSRREPLIRLAQHYYHKDDKQRTACYAAAALQIDRSDYYANDENHYRQVPHELLYWALWWLGKKDEALEHWKKCIEYMPTNPKFLSDAQFWPEMLPKVSILVPTLGRPEGLERLKKSIDAQIYPKHLIEVIIDDREEPTVPQKVNSMLSKATGEWLMYAANDLELDPFCIMSAMLFKKFEGEKHDYRLIAINDGEVLPDGGNKCAHFLIHKSLTYDLEDAQIFSEDFYHVGVDNWLMAQAERKGAFARCDNAKATHHHFSKSKAIEYDSVYQRGWGHAEEDRITLKAKLENLHG